MFNRIFISLFILSLNASNALAGVSNLESLIKIPAPAKYAAAVDTAKNATIKQSGIGDFYRNKVKSISKDFREQALEFVEDYAGIDRELALGFVGITSTVLVSKSLDLNVKSHNGFNYRLHIERQSVLTGVQLSF